jgi:peptide deformylase
MTNRPLTIYPDPILLRRCPEVTDFSADLLKLIEDMLETMYFEDGIGLAAPQIGVSLRVLVADISKNRDEPLAIVNPVVSEQSGSIEFEEGCLSIPGYRAKVSRFDSVRVDGFGATGLPVSIEATGLQAVCLQHEIDHLDGILFVDRLSQLKQDMFRRWWKKNRPQ